MSRLARSTLLLGVAVVSLAACSSSKGPGAIGTKDDIVVRNNGLPQSQQQQAAAPAPQTGDFTSTIEQGEAIPAPEVAAAEALPDTSPAVEHAVQAHADATAPLPSTATDPAMQSAVPADPATNPIDAVVPDQPVTQSVTPPSSEEMAAPVYAPAAESAPSVIPPVPESAPAATDGVYPETDYTAQTVTQVPPPAATYTAPPAPAIPDAAPLPPGVKYPLDPNAPYSPKAVAAAIDAAGVNAAESSPTSPAVAPMPSTPNINDPAVVRAAQAALKTQGGYRGPETGEVDAAFLNALILYQGKNNLPQGGLNEATLKHLGVFQ